MEDTGTSHSAISAALRPGHLHAVEPPETDGDRRRSDSWIPLLFAVGVGLVALVAWLSTSLPAAGTIDRAPPPQRSAVVERAAANLKEVCRSAARPREFCVEQARLVAGLAECDADCQALVRDELAADTAVR